MPDALRGSLYDTLFGTARTAPDRPCLLLEDGSVLDYGDVDGRAAALGGALASVGVARGDRVVVQIDKSADAVALYLACVRIGAVFVPLNTAYTPHEVGGFVDDAEPALVVVGPGSPAPRTTPGRAVLTLGIDGRGSLPERARDVDPAPIAAGGDDDPVAMLYTSGTTGRSKGAVLSARNLAANARALHGSWRFDPDDVLVHVLPVFHVHGLFVALHCAFLAGAATRLFGRFDPGAVRAALPTSTVLMGVPTHYHRLLADPAFGRAECEAMRLFTSGSAPLGAAEHDAFAARTGHRIVERYGMTETMILTSNPYDGDRRAGTVGFPLPGVDLRVADEEHVALPPDEVGTVEVRGEGVFLGYWRRPEQTMAARTPDGWFVTGDLGSVDSEGRLTLAGRASDLIISGGLNVHPPEVEAVLDTVAGVAECTVVGVPDADLGEVVVAAIVPEPGADPGETETALRAACEARLARFKHPRRYVVVDALPRNTMGKVQKAEVRAGLTGTG